MEGKWPVFFLMHKHCNYCTWNSDCPKNCEIFDTKVIILLPTSLRCLKQLPKPPDLFLLPQVLIEFDYFGSLGLHLKKIECKMCVIGLQQLSLRYG